MENIHSSEEFQTAVKLLRDKGATIVDNANFSALAQCKNSDSRLKDVVLFTDFKSTLNEYLSKLTENSAGIHNISDLIKYTKSTPEEEFPRFDVEAFETAESSKTSEDPLYKEALTKEAYFGGEGGILAALEKFDLDALIVPTAAEIPVLFAAIKGLPMIAVPLGVYPDGTTIQRNKKDDSIDIGPNVP